MSLAWRIRAVLPESQRRRARRLADLLLRPVGSIAGAAVPTELVALTFDDGPDPEVTPRVLEMLARRDARATFFMLTDHAKAHPDLVREVAACGHEIALHGDRHDRMTLVPPREVRRRLTVARAELAEISGQAVHLYRPPFGAQSLRTYVAARSAGLDVVVWGPYAAEWDDGSPEDLADRASRGLVAGSVLLLHDGLEVPAGKPYPGVDRAEAFERVLDRIAERSLRADSVAGVLAAGGTRRSAWFRP